MKQTLPPQSDNTKKRKRFNKFIKFTFYSTLLSSVLGAIVVAGLYLYISPNLPAVDSLKDVRFQVPLRIYSDDNKLIGEFGEKRRLPLKYEDIPRDMVHAILGAEDDRFFEHPGVDYHGILRAIKVMVTTGQKAQGGSTITMQVARNFFLSSEKTFLRKFSEIFLSFRIEEDLSKEEILTLYLNKIYLGNRSYGVGAAANMYYGKNIDELNVAQLAMIAGLPKAPSKYNPIVNAKRALIRRNYVLGRMLQLNYLSKEDYDEAVIAPVTAKLHLQSIELDAPYAAEMVRQNMVSRFGNDAYTDGYTVYTSINSRLQNQATRSLQYNLLAYEERHGYRGPEAHWDPLEFSEPEEWIDKLNKLENYPLLQPGVVISMDDKHAYIYMESGKVAELCWKGMKWAAPYVNGNAPGRKPKNAHDIFKVGDVVRLYDAGKRWSLGQRPEVEGALVSISSYDGSIQSMVGGYDFYHSKFNRAAQAKRQPGSNFKPFVYSAALEKGYTAATLINDAPVVFNDPGLEESWRPENYSGKFFGPTRLREALVKSRNLVSIRILRSIGVPYAINYVKRFGFNPGELPKDLSLALGSATVTPLAVAQGYATFSNGGYAVEPYLIKQIIDSDKNVLYEANPAVVCPKCEDELEKNEFVGELQIGDGFAQKPQNLAKRIISKENAYIMTTIMRDIIRRGTGRRALVLKRGDLAGKTGTTNDQRDAWFSGFNADIVTTAWVGFDKPHPLGDFESGARAALPMWITYMREALKGVKEKPLAQPPGLVTVRIDPESGMLVGGDFPNAIFESFRKKNVPKQTVTKTTTNSGQSEEAPAEDLSEQLF